MIRQCSALILIEQQWIIYWRCRQWVNFLWKGGNISFRLSSPRWKTPGRNTCHDMKILRVFTKRKTQPQRRCREGVDQILIDLRINLHARVSTCSLIYSSIHFSVSPSALSGGCRWRLMQCRKLIGFIGAGNNILQGRAGSFSLAGSRSVNKSYRLAPYFPSLHPPFPSPPPPPSTPILAHLHPLSSFSSACLLV